MHTLSNRRGITLIELLVTFSIIAILVAIFAFSYQGWTGRYSSESEIKQVFSDLSQARTEAMQESRDYFVKFSNDSGGHTSYTIYKDDNPKEGDGVLQPSGSTPHDDVVAGPKEVSYPMVWDNADYLIFDGRGLISDTRAPQPDPYSWTVEVKSSTSGNTTEDPDYDCITMNKTMINMGKWDVSSGECDVK